jgi:hypothetical protein
MAEDDKKDFRTIPGQKGEVRVSLSKRPKAAGEDEDGPPDKTGGYLPPVYNPQDDLIPPSRPFIYFHDLGTELLPAGQASYIERKGLIPLPWLTPYLSADYKLWEDEMLGALLGEGHEDEADPTKTWPIESSPRKRKAPNVWPWSLPAMEGLPNIILRRKAGTINPGYWLNVARPVTVTDEDWAAINTDEGLAPSYTYWKVKGYERYDAVGLSDGRYQTFITYDLAHHKITGESFFAAPEVEFKMGWPIKVYGVPRLLHVADGSSSGQMAGGASYTESRVTERGTLVDAGGHTRRYYWMETTSETSALDTLVGSNFYGENGLHSLARFPLIPLPWRFGLGSTLPPAEHFLAQMGPEGWRTWRLYKFYLRHVKTFTRERVIVDIGVSPRFETVTGPTTRIVTNMGPDGTDADEFVGRRPLPLSELIPLAMARVKSEIEIDLGRPFDSIPGTIIEGVQPSGDAPDRYYTGTAHINDTRAVSEPVYDFFTVGAPRVGQLLGLVVCGSKKYFVWKRA